MKNPALRFSVANCAFYTVYGLISAMILLELLGADDTSGFKQLIVAITTPLLAPFRALVGNPEAGSFQLILAYAVAIVVFALLHLAVISALRAFGSRQPVA